MYYVCVNSHKLTKLLQRAALINSYGLSGNKKTHFPKIYPNP